MGYYARYSHSRRTRRNNVMRKMYLYRYIRRGWRFNRILWQGWHICLNIAYIFK